MKASYLSAKSNMEPVVLFAATKHLAATTDPMPPVMMAELSLIEKEVKTNGIYQYDMMALGGSAVFEEDLPRCLYPFTVVWKLDDIENHVVLASEEQATSDKWVAELRKGLNLDVPQILLTPAS